VLVVMDDIGRSRRRFALAVRESAATVARGARLVWNPDLPLAGELDRLSGLRLEWPKHAAALLGTRSASGARAHVTRVRGAFTHEALEPSARVDPERRRELLSSLQVLVARDGGLLDSTPSARALVLEELERAERHRRNEQAALEAISELRTLKRRLYPYQREGVERFLFAGRLLLADDMGLGKTTQAIAACHALFGSGRVTRGLVIAPSSLKPQWLREWQETTSVPAAVVEGTPQERARQYREFRSGFLILNYEQLLRDAERVQAIRADIVVLDEAQRIKNYATKSAIYVKALQPEYRLVLTGTPMENRLEELASILDWIDDVALSPKWRLVPWYTRWEGDGGKGKAGARNLDTLRLRLAPCLVRRLRRDVLGQLPSRTDTRVPVDLTPQQAVEHDELSAPIAGLVQRGKRRPLRQAEFLKLMQLLTQQRIIANGLGQLRFEEIWPAYSKARPDPSLLEGLFAPKLLELRRLLTDLVIDQGRKVVVFSQWRRMLRLAEWSVRDVLGDGDVRAVFFTGAEKQSQRTRNIVDFHDDPRVRVMFLSDAGGVGLNLQKAASACINLELPWNPAVLEQRIGRIYRLGQKRPIDVYNLVSEGSIEARIASLVGAKQALFSGLFDGTCDEIRFDAAASFLTRVERMVDPGVLPEAPVSAAGPPVEDGDGDSAAVEVQARLDDAALADELPVAPASLVRSDADEDTSRAADAVASDVTPAVASDVSPATNDPVAAAFDLVRVERTADGGVRIEAPPEAAGSLVALFQGMARLLASAVKTP
jgi:SNF2 family DNA or RNA helicase